MSDGPDVRRAAVAARQAAFVAALVSGGDPPEGVDAHRLEAAAAALLRKRTGEVARRWPALLAGPEARAGFAAWARSRPRRGSFADGWDFAEQLERAGDLDGPGAAELAAARRAFSRGPDGAVRRRRLWPSPRALRQRGR